MEELFRSITTTNVTLDDIIALAIAYFNMGLMHIDCTEENELHACENYFTKCLELLKGKELHCKAILTSVEVYIKLQCILIKRQKTQKSELFYKAMELYLEYTKEENKYPNPINIPSILGIEKEELNSRLLLDELHLTTINYLLNQYHYWPKNQPKLVIYVHNLLNKQIPETMKFLDVGCYYWALASVNLIEYFLSECHFTEARHHLAAAEYMMEKFYKDKLENTTLSEPLHALMLDKYQDASAYIARYWGFYGNILLRSSKDKFYQRDDESCKTDNSESKSLINSKENITDFLLFTDLEKDLESITSEIPDTYVLNLNDAKTIFAKILNWLNIAQKYFTEEKNFVTHGRILLETSSAYKYFAHFEYSKDNLIKMHKRRIEILEKSIEKLHLKAKTEEELQVCKQIHFELGIAYTSFISIRDDKLDKLEKNIFIDTDCPDICNINSETLELVKKAKEYFNLYLNS